jgi:hypothetical protein
MVVAWEVVLGGSTECRTLSLRVQLEVEAASSLKLDAV